MNAPKIPAADKQKRRAAPDGYRWLTVGEKIRATDLFSYTTGQTEPPYKSDIGFVLNAFSASPGVINLLGGYLRKLQPKASTGDAPKSPKGWRKLRVGTICRDGDRGLVGGVFQDLRSSCTGLRIGRAATVIRRVSRTKRKARK